MGQPPVPLLVEVPPAPVVVGASGLPRRRRASTSSQREARSQRDDALSDPTHRAPSPGAPAALGEGARRARGLPEARGAPVRGPRTCAYPNRAGASRRFALRTAARGGSGAHSSNEAICRGHGPRLLREPHASVRFAPRAAWVAWLLVSPCCAQMERRCANGLHDLRAHLHKPARGVHNGRATGDARPAPAASVGEGGTPRSARSRCPCWWRARRRSSRGSGTRRSPGGGARPRAARPRGRPR